MFDQTGGSEMAACYNLRLTFAHLSWRERCFRLGSIRARYFLLCKY